MDKQIEKETTGRQTERKEPMDKQPEKKTTGHQTERKEPMDKRLEKKTPGHQTGRKEAMDKQPEKETPGHQTGRKEAMDKQPEKETISHQTERGETTGERPTGKRFAKKDFGNRRDSREYSGGENSRDYRDSTDSEKEINSHETGRRETTGKRPTGKYFVKKDFGNRRDSRQYSGGGGSRDSKSFRGPRTYQQKSERPREPYNNRGSQYNRRGPEWIGGGGEESGEHSRDSRDSRDFNNFRGPRTYQQKSERPREPYNNRSSQYKGRGSERDRGPERTGGGGEKPARYSRDSKSFRGPRTYQQKSERPREPYNNRSSQYNRRGPEWIGGGGEKSGEYSRDSRDSNSFRGPRTYQQKSERPREPYNNRDSQYNRKGPERTSEGGYEKPARYSRDSRDSKGFRGPRTYQQKSERPRESYNNRNNQYNRKGPERTERPEWTDRPERTSEGGYEKPARYSRDSKGFRGPRTYQQKPDRDRESYNNRNNQYNRKGPERSERSKRDSGSDEDTIQYYDDSMDPKSSRTSQRTSERPHEYDDSHYYKGGEGEELVPFSSYEDRAVLRKWRKFLFETKPKVYKKYYLEEDADETEATTEVGADLPSEPGSDVEAAIKSGHEELSEPESPLGMEADSEQGTDGLETGIKITNRAEVRETISPDSELLILAELEGRTFARICAVQGFYALNFMLAEKLSEHLATLSREDDHDGNTILPLSGTSKQIGTDEDNIEKTATDKDHDEDNAEESAEKISADEGDIEEATVGKDNIKKSAAGKGNVKKTGRGGGKARKTETGEDNDEDNAEESAEKIGTDEANAEESAEKISADDGNIEEATVGKGNIKKSATGKSNVKKTGRGGGNAIKTETAEDHDEDNAEESAEKISADEGDIEEATVGKDNIKKSAAGKGNVKKTGRGGGNARKTETAEDHDEDNAEESAEKIGTDEANAEESAGKIVADDGNIEETGLGEDNAGNEIDVMGEKEVFSGFEAMLVEQLACVERFWLLHSNREVTALEMKYAKRLIRGTFAYLQGINQFITANLVGWDLERLPLMRRSILQVFLYSLANDKETPRKVIINDGVQLAKWFLDEKDYKFINAVLDKYK